MTQVVDNHFIDLTKAKSGHYYTVQEILDKELALKLMEMGFMKGMEIQKQSTAPFSGPLLLKVFPNGNLLALRYEEAEKVLVSLLFG